MNILEVQNLKKYFATQKAVDGISLNIEQGSIFGLLGPNGAGKTTLIRMITGIFYPDSGHIKFNGKKFDPQLDPMRIGYMPEERGLYKKMKIGEQALYLARLKGLSKSEAMKAVKEWFVKFEMESWWNKKVEDLSKGMSQKLQFVTTVLHQPKLIILDEPFSGLDPVNANMIKEEIIELARLGSTIIFSTHRMEQVEEICNHIVLINKGIKVLDGNVKKIKQDFKENLFAVETHSNQMPEASHLYTIVNTQPGHYKLRLEEGVTTNSVLSHLIANNITILKFNEVLPSLDEIFIRLVESSGATRKFQNIKG
jgi:ABC-2 type transport system ATP-binding protein